MSNSLNFSKGMQILQEYCNEKTKIMVCEQSSIVLERLSLLSENDILSLRELGWTADNTSDGKSGIVYYHKLKYADY